ncbi:MCP four helix bundle domain-containing protein [Telluria beijingensis]|uniref:MCP four helix bundle domain-containing protein n=1 Tax=Telluria beijingensis TaxID=3068633 RepID=UPI002795AF86|nr:MCP four helix bundle domain-containing protein [Massilia sp. REN29]
MTTPPANRLPGLSMLARLRIGPKLLLAPGTVLLLLLLLSCAAYYALARQNASLEAIVGQRAASMRAASNLAAQSQKAHADIYRLLSWMGGSFPVARTEPLRQDILAQHGRIDAGLAALARHTLTEAEDRHVEQAALAQRRYAQAVREVIELAPLDGSISANAMQKAESAFALVAQRLADLGALEEALSREASSSAKADFRMISVLMPAVLLLAIGLSLAITFAVRRILLDEIRAIGLAASGLASGDLTVRQGVDHDYGGDEIADTSRQLDASIRNLNGTLRVVLESARLIGAASRDIKLGSLSLGSRAVFRASALAHTESALRELAAGFKPGEAGEGQASQLEDVGQAIVQMDQVTRQNCTLVEEAASAARILQMQALVLSRTVAGFRLDEEGEAPAAAPVQDAGKGDAGRSDGGDDPARERRGASRERRRHQASHLRLASSRK